MSLASAKQMNDDDGGRCDDGQAQTKKRRVPFVKLSVGITLLAFIAFIIVDSATDNRAGATVSAFLEWIESNVIAGVFAFMGVYFVATVLFVPGSVLTLGGGFVFGKALGLGRGVALASSAVFIGASLGAIASFLLGRYLLRDWVTERLFKKYKIMTALGSALEEKGFQIAILLRLSPIIPFNAINYILGATSMRLVHYIFSLLGILPGTVLYCFIGATAGSLTESGSAVSGPVAVASLIVGIVFGLASLFLVGYYAKKEFDKIVPQQAQSQGTSEQVQGDTDDMV
ncbi:hypothetical protein THAOC_13931 [Thalassiosira oceanica]|uniref:VTT domain-containing protein n=1 Tax=Thalassiosira oceanica TaxID=159749 RepID=K0SIW2_THAOC|nr:hypothetical protein THAOC_13931 [Thalassiosira oceanica]|mmetsp:Transcript_2145/g.5114  ORF Transcript_2145/g.5114 Transcript_2145/m.5114 type:complete len:286 (+) Transcript_2145:100-957(+)|eukprot:EJK65235.1 hypothetical protein THAOC_13931 [Thalassiosira oceanica]